MNFFDKRKVEEIVKDVQSGKDTALNLVEKSLRIIAEKNPEINAFITVCYDYAIAEAKRIDSLSAQEKQEMPLCGIPIAVKDNISTKGIRTTCASKMLENYIPTFDAHVVEELKKAGAIIVGKTNMDEFAMGSSNETSFYGKVKNPVDTSRVPGGSSGGSAAAVAAGMTPLSLGSDTGGSIRQPASYCGIVGIKPTYGLVSRYGLIAFASSLDQIGPMAANVEDAEYLLRVIATADKRDATNCGKSYAGVEKKDIKDVVIGIPKEYLSDELPQNVRALFDEKVKYLKEKGAKFIEISLPNMQHAIAVYYVIATAEASSNLSRFDGVRFGYRTKEDVKSLYEMFKHTRAEGFGEEVKRRIMLGTYVLSSGYYDAYYIKAAQVRSLITKDFDSAFGKCDIILSPTTPSPAFEIGSVADPLEMYLNDIYTVSANLAGCGAIALNMGEVDGLPIGIQIMSPNFKGEYAYTVSKELEKSN